MAWLTAATPAAGLVDLQDLTIVVAYDEVQADDQLATRIAGYRAVRVADGVQWGGREQLRFAKNLLLAPRPGGGYQRLDLLNAANMTLALRLNRRIDMALAHQPSAFRRTLRLPRLWAGYSTARAASVVGSGPEIQELCGQFGLEPAAMLRKFERTSGDLTFFPLEWVGDQLPLASRVCAEIEGFPRLQVFGVSDPAVDLVGFAGAAAYQFAPAADRTGRINATSGQFCLAQV